MARDLCAGLEYLHSNNVVHRDLKPDNVLISNKHYAEGDKIDKYWMEKPVIAKLTDFGESRSELIQTSSKIHTSTMNVKRGSPVYMAPELHISTKDSLTLDELKSVDVWALGMVLYHLINPNTKYPFKIEMDKLRERGISGALVWHVMRNQNPPTHDKKYEKERDTVWKDVVALFDAAAVFESHKRPSARHLCSMIQASLSK